MKAPPTHAAPGQHGVAPAWTRLAVAALVALCLAHGTVLWYLHDKFWYPTDDGFYAHIAERLLSGEVLGRDVQDIHPGYIHAIHVLAFRSAGVDIVSLRYPLMAVAILHTVCTFALLRRRHLLVAVAGASAAACLGTIQFFNPNPNWYCLALATLVVWWLVATPVGAPHRLVVAGAILGLATSLRHLSGAWMAMGLLTVVLIERQDGSRGRDAVLGRALACVMLGGTLSYMVLTSAAKPGSAVLMALWPCAILAFLVGTLSAPNGRVVRAAVQVGAGGVVTAGPLLAYHAWHGSLGSWLTDIVLRALGETHLPFFDGVGWYALLPMVAFRQLLRPAAALEMASAVYWLVLPLASALNGYIVVSKLRRGDDVAELTPGIVAVFFAMVSVLLEGPLYLYYSVSLSLTALLWHAAPGSTRVRSATVATVMLVSAVGLTRHAGQPLNRAPFDILRGTRVPYSGRVPMLQARASLSLPQAEVTEQARLLTTIQSLVPPEESILVLPNDAQLYFLAQRRNSGRFYNAALGIQSSRELADFLRLLSDNPPHAVIFRDGDKYHTPMVDAVMREVRARYSLATTMSGWQIYLRGSASGTER